MPAFLTYLSDVGWKITIITLASTTGADLFARVWPGAFAEAAGTSTTFTVVLWFVVVLAVTMVVSVLGHQVIMRMEVWISWVTGIMTLGFLGFVLPEVDRSRLGDTPAGGAAVLVGGVVLAMTLVGIGFLDYGGDFARYLPASTPARGVVGWTVAGLTVPVVVLLVVGALLVGSNPDLGAAAAADPIDALTALLPMWFFVPSSIVVVSLLSAAITGIYSSGLALMAVGIPLMRSLTTVVNALVIAAGAFYLLFVSTSFLATFQSFLSLVAVTMGTVGGIVVVDLVRRRRRSWSTDMALQRGYGGLSARWTALLSLAVGTVLGVGFVTSSDPNFAKVTGFLLGEQAREGVLASSNIGVVLALVVGPALCAALTFGFTIDPEPDYSRARDAGRWARRVCTLPPGRR